MYFFGFTDLIPTNGRKSFYGKAKVLLNEDLSVTLFSYGTKIATKKKDGEIVRHYFGKKTNTTCAHLKSFLGEKDYKGFWERS